MCAYVSHTALECRAEQWLGPHVRAFLSGLPFREDMQTELLKQQQRQTVELRANAQ